jgi:hypothetical protein
LFGGFEGGLKEKGSSLGEGKARQRQDKTRQGKGKIRQGRAKAR